MENFKDFTKVATLYETTSGNTYDANKHRIDNIETYCKENKIKEIIVFSQEQNYAGFRSFYANQVTNKENKISAIRLDYYNDDNLFRLGSYTNTPSKNPNPYEENKHHITNLINYAYYSPKYYYYYGDRSLKHVFINEDLTITLVYAVKIGTRIFTYVVNPTCLFNGKSINDIHLGCFYGTRDLVNKGIIAQSVVNNLAQESDIFDIIKNIRDDNGKKWVIEITDQNINDLEFIKIYGIPLTDRYSKDLVRHGNSGINDIDARKSTSDGVTVYYLTDTYHQTSCGDRYLSDSTLDKMISTFSNCGPAAQICAARIAVERNNGKILMKDLIDIINNSRKIYNKSLTEAKNMTKQKKQTVMTEEEMFEKLTFPENCTGFVAQRVGGVIYIAGNTTPTDDYHAYWRLRSGKWVIAYDTINRKKALYERFTYGGNTMYEKKALLEHIAIETLTTYERYDFGIRRQMNAPKLGWKFIPSFDEVFKDTLIGYLSNAPEYIISKYEYGCEENIREACTEAGWCAYSIKLLMTGVKPMFEMLAKSQLYHMYALYSEERAAGSNFCKTKIGDNSYGYWSDAYYANIHKGKDLATMFGLTIKQLRVYDAYLAKVMYDENHKKINNATIIGLSHIEDVLDPLSIEEMRAILSKIDPEYANATNAEVLEGAFKYNIHANAVKTVDVATLGKMFDEIAKSSKCGRSGLSKWNISPFGKGYEIDSTEAFKAYIRPMKLVKRAEFIAQLITSGDSRDIIKDYWRMRTQIFSLAETMPDRVLGGYINSLRQADPQNLKGMFDANGQPNDAAYTAAKSIMARQYPLWPSKKTVYVRYNPEDTHRNCSFGGNYIINMIKSGCAYLNDISEDNLNRINIASYDQHIITINDEAVAFGDKIYNEDIFLSQTITKMFAGNKADKYRASVCKNNYRWGGTSNREGTPTDRSVLSPEDIELDYSSELVKSDGCQVSIYPTSGSLCDKICYNVTSAYHPLNGVLMHLNQFEAMKYLHDTLSSILSLYKDEAKELAFASTSKRVEDLEYSDKESGLSIVVPRKASEVISEGHTLGHCVASYVDSIIDGKCNILFIRHTDMIDKPYFTMEITPTGEIRQVHSYHNGQVSIDSQRQAYSTSGYEVYKEPKDIVAFLTRWAKACAKAHIAPSLKSIKDNYGALCHL